jgi:hypothetical protein
MVSSYKLKSAYRPLVQPESVQPVIDELTKFLGVSAVRQFAANKLNTELARRRDLARAPLWQAGTRQEFRDFITSVIPDSGHNSLAVTIDDILVLRNTGKRLLYLIFDSDTLRDENKGVEDYLASRGVNPGPRPFRLQLGICEFDSYVSDEYLDHLFDYAPEEVELNQVKFDIKTVTQPER